MSAVAFDTLKFAQANFSPAQAEGVSQAFSEAITDQLATRGDLADLATKADIGDLRKEMGAFRLQAKGDIAELRTGTKDDIADLRREMAAFRLQWKEDLARLEVKIESTRSEILRWMFGQTLLILGAVLAIGRFWH
jgi:hypothetical protein